MKKCEHDDVKYWDNCLECGDSDAECLKCQAFYDHLKGWLDGKVSH